jgi:hypothetical protein
MGLHLKKEFNRGNVGILFSHRSRKMPLKPEKRIHNAHNFEGSDNYVASLHYDYLLGEISFFGESALSKSGGSAFINGVILPLGRKSDLSILHRRYDPSFHTIAGAPFSEGSNPQNESGLYFGLKHRVCRRWVVSAYADSFRNPWPKSNLRSPGGGQEVLTRIDHRLNGGNEVMLQYRFGNYEYSNSELSQSYKVQRKRQDEIVIQFRQFPTEQWSLRTRIQYKNAMLETNSNGFIISQDAQYANKKWSVAGRLAYFSTDDYNSRFYILEKDVLYSLSAPAYFGQGARQYILIKYRPLRSLSIWFKWARTIRTDVTELGSGNEQIAGNRRNDLRFQVKLSF